MTDPRGGDWSTPWEFVRCAEETLRVRFVLDLASTKDNAKADKHLGPESFLGNDSLKADWMKVWKFVVPKYRKTYGLAAFLNPPYSHIPPWIGERIEMVSGVLEELAP